MICRFKFNWISKAFVIAFLVLGSSTMAFSQQSKNGQDGYYNWEVGLNFGSLGFYGDVGTPKNLSSQLKTNFDAGCGISFSKQISPLFGIKGDFIMGNLKGQSALYTFQSDLIEADIDAMVNFSQLCWGINRKQLVTVYGLVGIGTSNFNGKTIDKSNGEIIHSFGLESGRGINGNKLECVANVGLCIAFDLGNNLKATVESAIKFTKDDNLDGIVSGFKYDSYNFTSFGIYYKLPLAKKH